MRFARTLPPAAAPVSWTDFACAIAALAAPARAIQAREREIREFFGARQVVLASSGTAALAVTLEALKTLAPRHEVVIPAYTCPSVPAAVLKAGLHPVLCDVDPRTFDFEYRSLDRVLGPDTLCVLAHHPFGVAANVARIRAAARRHGAFVVEDAAQAMGVTVNGRLIGTMGDVGIFSLGRGKSITCGSGGIAMTSSEPVGRALAAAAARLAPPTTLDVLRQLAMLACMAVFVHPWLYWLPASLPFLRLGQTIYPTRIALKRLSALQAGFLAHWRERLQQAVAVRSSAVGFFQQALDLAGPAAPPYSRLPVLVADDEERERLNRLSHASGLGFSAGYPTAVNDIPELRDRFRGQRYPGADHVAARLITLPTHHHVSPRDRQAIVACLRTSRGAATPSREWRKAS
jgi:dTDP-4-amino-4,6-dideoxygalactose transaminase